MQLTRNTKSVTGAFTKTVHLFTNDAKSQNVSLVCTGTVRAPLRTTPRSLGFGTIERDGEPRTKTVKLSRGDGGPLSLELLPIEHENVTAALREVEPGEEYELNVELRPPWPKGAVRTKLTLKTGVPEAPEYEMNVYARIAPRLTANPPRFMVPVELDSESDVDVKLVWSGGDPGEILEVSCSDSELAARYEERDDGQHVLLHVPPGYARKGKGRPYVTVKTNDPEAETYRIHVYPTGKRNTPNRPALSPQQRPGPRRTKVTTTTAPAPRAVRPAKKTSE